MLPLPLAKWIHAANSSSWPLPPPTCPHCRTYRCPLLTRDICNCPHCIRLTTWGHLRGHSLREISMHSHWLTTFQRKVTLSKSSIKSSAISDMSKVAAPTGTHSEHTWQDTGWQPSFNIAFWRPIHGYERWWKCNCIYINFEWSTLLLDICSCCKVFTIYIFQ